MAALGAAGRAAAQAQEFDLLGPIRARDLTPFGLLRLEMLPTPASSALSGSWTLEAELNHSNVFAKSENVREYLIERGGREPITRRDVDNILAMPGNVLYLDGEVGLLDTTLHYHPGGRWSASLTLPVYYFTGGFLDSTIESFHSALGLGQGERTFVARDQFTMIYRVGREQVVHTSAPGAGLGDPILGLRYRILPDAGPWDLIVEGNAKVSLRNRGDLSTGDNDFGFQLALHRTFRRQAAYLEVGDVRGGDARFNQGVKRWTVPTLHAGYELGLTPHTSALAQLYLSPSVYGRSEVKDFVQTRYELLAGIRTRRGPAVWSFSVIENAVHSENTPDIGFQLGLTWLWQPRD